MQKRQGHTQPLQGHGHKVRGGRTGTCWLAEKKPYSTRTRARNVSLVHHPFHVQILHGKRVFEISFWEDIINSFHPERANGWNVQPAPKMKKEERRQISFAMDLTSLRVENSASLCFRRNWRIKSNLKKDSKNTLPGGKPLGNMSCRVAFGSLHWKKCGPAAFLPWLGCDWKMLSHSVQRCSRIIHPQEMWTRMSDNRQ